MAFVEFQRHYRYMARACTAQQIAASNATSNATTADCWSKSLNTRGSNWCRKVHPLMSTMPMGSDVACRACVKAHKVALMAQRAFWRSVLDDKVKLSNLLSQLGYLHKAGQKAMTIYKR